MDAEIDDGSGEATLSGLGDMEVDDGSGELYVEDIRGSVEIDDGSGELEIRDVQGDVFVDDGSGSIEIRDVGQNVMAYEIGSGAIRVSGVEGNFTVRGGRFERIRYSDVRSMVDLPEPRRRGRDRR
jgi:DUF4097 and DUF4098 domain-containing protein YvlB